MLNLQKFWQSINPLRETFLMTTSQHNVASVVKNRILRHRKEPSKSNLRLTNLKLRTSQFESDLSQTRLINNIR